MENLLHTTPLGEKRILRNLRLKDCDIMLLLSMLTLPTLTAELFCKRLRTIPRR